MRHIQRVIGAETGPPPCVPSVVQKRSASAAARTMTPATTHSMAAPHSTNRSGPAGMLPCYTVQGYSIAMHTHRKTAPPDKSPVVARLKRIEGQVRGVQRMIDENRDCVDVLMQVSAILESLRKVSETLLREHLDRCVTTAVDSGDRKEKVRIYDELADLFNKYAR